MLSLVFVLCFVMCWACGGFWFWIVIGDWLTLTWWFGLLFDYFLVLFFVIVVLVVVFVWLILLWRLLGLIVCCEGCWWFASLVGLHVDFVWFVCFVLFWHCFDGFLGLGLGFWFYLFEQGLCCGFVWGYCGLRFVVVRVLLLLVCWFEVGCYCLLYGLFSWLVSNCLLCWFVVCWNCCYWHLFVGGLVSSDLVFTFCWLILLLFVGVFYGLISDIGLIGFCWFVWIIWLVVDLLFGLS